LYPIFSLVVRFRYVLTPHSLYAAVSIGLATSSIIGVLERLSKVPLHPSIYSFVEASTENYGKAKLVLQNNRFFIESEHPKVLRLLLEDSVISGARVIAAKPATATATEGGNDGFLVGQRLADAAAADLARVGEVDLTAEGEDDEEAAAALREVERGPLPAGPPPMNLDQSSAMDVSPHLHSFEVRAEAVEHVKQRCLPGGLNHPMLEEYDFKNDPTSPDLGAELKPVVQVNPYCLVLCVFIASFFMLHLCLLSLLSRCSQYNITLKSSMYKISF
jgi:DNA excision repair protein ERCC-3